MSIRKGDLVGPFTIIKRLSVGGMAEVFLVTAPNLEGEYVLKVSRRDHTNPAFHNALKLEAEILAKLSHPNILRIIPLPLGAKSDPFVAKAVGHNGQPWYYAMEYLRGNSLATVLKSVKILPLNLSCAIGVGMINALYYLHNRRIAHLDVKPENVLFRYPLEKGAKIESVMVDFGVSSRSMQGDATGGTMIVMSPEYLRRVRGMIAPEIRVDLSKVDIYSVGVVMYRMWTGQYPFKGGTESNLTSSILNTVPQPPSKLNPELPKEVDRLMHYWISKNPHERPDLRTLHEMLSRWAHGMTHMSGSLSSGKGAWSLFKRG